MIASIGVGEVPHSSILIPLSAVVPLPSDPDHFAVMIAQDRAGRLVANLRKVQLGTTHDNSVAVEKVQPGERVISVGAQLLKDGDPTRGLTQLFWRQRRTSAPEGAACGCFIGASGTRVHPELCACRPPRMRRTVRHA